MWLEIFGEKKSTWSLFLCSVFSIHLFINFSINWKIYIQRILRKYFYFPLGSTNFIEPGFYDIGQLRPGTKFLTLEEYAKQELNEKRPIIVINPKPE